MEHEADLSGPTLIEETLKIPTKIQQNKKKANGTKPKSLRWLKKIN